MIANTGEKSRGRVLILKSHLRDIELVDLFRFRQTERGNVASTLTDEMNKLEGKW